MAKRLISFLASLIAIILALFSFTAAQSSDDVYRTETFQTSASPEVAIQTSGGAISVTGHDKDEVEVRMYVQRRGTYLSPSDTDLSEFEITIAQEGDKIIAKAEREEGWSRMLRQDRSTSISFVIYAPSGSLINGSTSGGVVTAKNIHNDISLRTSGGSVRAENISGKSDFRTSGGSIRLNMIEGDLHARTSGGSIRAERITGTAELRTSGGGIQLEQINAKLSAQTSGGSITADFISFRDDIELRTSGGSINIRIPETEHFDINLAGMRVNSDLKNFTGSSSRNSLSGKIGDGGPMLSARTSGGSVRVSTQ
ncbi:MAG: DUF4097 family beta strand repeat protein [Balneolaceae bacterium]|nr:DUF4097 family beta strand repeat protein [Balneolaceae bacterium]MCH8548107.1 DUF4097 domain-containing protein [Balneolaceae bacterium]